LATILKHLNFLRGPYGWPWKYILGTKKLPGSLLGQWEPNSWVNFFHFWGPGLESKTEQQPFSIWIPFFNNGPSNKGRGYQKGLNQRPNLEGKTSRIPIGNFGINPLTQAEKEKPG